MSKTLSWLVGILILVVVAGNIFAWYTFVKRDTVTVTSDSISSTGTSETNVPTSAATVETVKSTHCLKTPAKGSAITITDLVDYSVTKSPITFSGIANVFENVFEYRLKDCSGKIIAKGTANAIGEAGQNATFLESINFTITKSPTDAILEVYQISLADESETNLFQVPLRLTN